MIMPPKDPEQHRLYSSTYYYEHLEESRERIRTYDLAHKEAKRLYNTQYRLKNSERLKAQDKAYFAEHRGKRNAAKRVHRLANLEKTAAANRAWRLANPDKVKILSERRRAHKAKAPVNDFTVDEWKTMKAHYGHRCVYCGKQQKNLTQDHITPLSKGGSHTKANIVPACKSCNSKKREGPPLVPVQPMLL